MAPAFIGPINEGLIVAVIKMRNDDRAAEASAKGVGHKLGLLRDLGELIGDRIEGSFLVIQECRTMDGMSSAFGGNSVFSRLAEFGIVHGTVCAQLCNRLAGRKG